MLRLLRRHAFCLALNCARTVTSRSHSNFKFANQVEYMYMRIKCSEYEATANS